MSALYHSEVFMPPAYARPCFHGKLRYSHHAQAAAADDRYGQFKLPEQLDMRWADLIETEVADGDVLKQVWRVPLDGSRDLVLAIQRGGFVRTVWINLHSDKHNTLDRSKYQLR